AITNNTIDATGLAAGAYKVTITDNGGCVITKDITVPTSGGELTFLSMEITTANQFNGFAVSCFGLKNGVVTGSFSGGTPPFAVAYTGAGTGSKNVNVAGSFSFDKLGAGNYEFKITDASGMSKTRTIILTEPQRITVDVVRTCVNGIANDGAAAVTVTGGVPNYTYRWSNGSTESSISGLARGSYNSVIEDQNGCQVTAVARIVGCGDAENGCYSGLSIMTPNNDGYNDLFIINCATDVPGKLTVYDRYGKQVYQKDVYDNTWDGIDSSGQILPEGSYMWVLEVSFPSGIEIFTGTVTVLRD
ncbi:MAG: gliding motility-associated C-terminal domain-containing protein, partial [Saprospiraceae bacterium]|nr:gliding motility-associated C-terminal domain-containing protein [Saprospiraceae bacterium]